MPRLSQLLRKDGAIRTTLPIVLVLGGVFAAALFAAHTITNYQQAANTEHVAARHTTELASLLTGEQARNFVVMARGRMGEEEIAGFATFRVLVADLTQDLERTKPNDPAVAELKGYSGQYWGAMDQQVLQARDGRIDEARAGFASITTPLHEQRMEVVSAANQKYKDGAAAAEGKATLATLLITVGGALGVSILLLMASRHRAASQLAHLQARMVEESEARFRSLIQNAASVITVVSETGVIQYQSATVTPTFGYQPTDLLHSPFADVVHPNDRPAYERTMRKALELPGASETIEARITTRDGVWIDTEIVAQNLTSDAHIRGVVLTTRDIRERKTLENQLTLQALHDTLTGLPNRRLFRDRLAHALSGAARQQRNHAVIFLDLDDFKLVNDSLGHLAGDSYLVAVAGRLSASVRSNDTVARFGGDEFAVLLEDASETDLAEISGRLLDVFETPFLIEGREIKATASLGIVSAGDEVNPDELLRDADTAMYIAKARGKGRSEVFTPSMHAALVDRLDLERDLREGITNGDFRVHYQPILAFDSQTITGLEALVRWQHPHRGLLMPSHFIGVAEETGLIVALGDFVLNEACTNAATWQEQYGRDLTLSVNLSARQLNDIGITDRVAATLQETGFPARSLVLEITETVLAISTPSLVQRLKDLRALGIRLAIDDFGTGYSSLSYLQDFPVDIVKIDKSFVDGLGGDHKSAALPEAVVAMARALNLKTVAEGVESLAQVTQLNAMGCDSWQGFYFARPLDVDGIDKLLGQPAAKELGTARRLKLAS